MPEMTIQEKIRRGHEVIARLRDFTAPSLVQICGSFDDASGELVGSGTVIEMVGDLYLVTAAHVADKFFETNTDGSRRYQHLAHSMGNGQAFAYIPGPWRCYPRPLDLAITRLDREFMSNGTIVPMCESSFARTSYDVPDNDLLFVHGWPGKRSHPYQMIQGVHSKSQPYGSTKVISQWPHFDGNYHLAMGYAISESCDAQGNQIDAEWPEGMSGSLLWRANCAGAGDAWVPELARVVGVIHTFDMDTQCLIGTRIEYLRWMVADLRRSEYAYYRWQNRGKPGGDDWADWFEAEKAISFHP